MFLNCKILRKALFIEIFVNALEIIMRKSVEAFLTAFSMVCVISVIHFCKKC